MAPMVDTSNQEEDYEPTNYTRITHYYWDKPMFHHAERYIYINIYDLISCIFLHVYKRCNKYVRNVTNSVYNVTAVLEM